MKTAELTIKRLKLDTLRPHPKNPRIHPEPGTPQWETLKKSLESDYFDPIVVNVGKTEPSLKNTLVSGHLRTKVLIESGFTQADCVIVDYDDPTHTARMLAANRLAGQDDEAAVFALLKDLHRTQGDVDDGKTCHSTQKPVECMARPIRNNSQPGDLVYEPFSGSGTTIIACEQLNRRCRAMEISPGYVAVALQRWADATGKTPVLL